MTIVSGRLLCKTFSYMKIITITLGIQDLSIECINHLYFLSFPIFIAEFFQSRSHAIYKKNTCYRSTSIYYAKANPKHFVCVCLFLKSPFSTWIFVSLICFFDLSLVGLKLFFDHEVCATLNKHNVFASDASSFKMTHFDLHLGVIKHSKTKRNFHHVWPVPKFFLLFLS